MPAVHRVRIFPWGLLLLGVAALLLALFGYATAPGLSGTPDSRYYLFAAGSWREKSRFLQPDGTPYRYWPPLFPLLLSWAGTSARLRAVHAVCLLGTLAGWSAVGRQLLPPRRARALPLLVALSASALVLSKFVWAETVFGLLWAAYVWALLRWRRTGRWSAFGLSTAAGFLLPLQRSTGLFLLAGVGLALLLERPDGPAAPGRPARLLHLLLSGSGALLWQLHVWPLPAPAGAYENRGWGQLLSSMADYGFVLLRWLWPLAASWRAAAPAFLWAAALPAVLALLWPRRRQNELLSSARLAHPPAEAARGGGAVEKTGFEPPTASLRLLWAAAVACLLLLLPATVLTRSAAGPHDGERYASALYPVVVLLVLHCWPAAPKTGFLRHFRPPSWRRLSYGLLLIWLLYAGLRTLHNAQKLRASPLIGQLPR